MPLSNRQLDLIGDQLRHAPDEASVGFDARTAYDEYRASFAEAIEEVMADGRDCAEVLAGASRLKTLSSTREKLVRQPSARLSQIDDIGGCRIVVKGTKEQDAAIAALQARYGSPRMRDYREVSQGGYRAVHLILTAPRSGKRVEMQIRTRPQNAWANLSEKMATQIDPRIKYGSGAPELREGLDKLSQVGKDIDDKLVEVEAMLISFETDMADVQKFQDAGIRDARLEALVERRDDLRASLRGLVEMWENALEEFDKAVAALAVAFGLSSEGAEL